MYDRFCCSIAILAAFLALFKGGFIQMIIVFFAVIFFGALAKGLAIWVIKGD